MIRRKRSQLTVPLLALSIFLLIAVVGTSHARNKVHYQDLVWRVLPAEKADIYYYQGEEEIAQQAVEIANEFTRKLEAWLDFSFTTRVPIVVYAGHPQFANTNITPYILPEGVAGFTELIKGRVVLPYTGSRAGFRHVLAHELVHAALRQKLMNLYTRVNKRNAQRLPLWLEEGLAEYLSAGFPAKDSAYIAELVVGGGLVSLPNIWRISGSYRMYKQGQCLLAWLIENRGETFLSELVESGVWDPSFSKGMEKALGYSLNELDRRWQADLRKRYMPKQAERSLAVDLARPLTSPGNFAIGATAFNRNGKNYLAFISTIENDLRIIRQQFDEKGALCKTKTLLLAGISLRAESFPMLGNRLASSPDGSLLAIPVRSGPRYDLLLMDSLSGAVRRRIKMKGYLSLSSPSFSPDGKQIVFCATDSSGKPDLYLADVSTGSTQRLTEDIRCEAYPGFLSDGNHIAYLADDGNRLHYTRSELFVLDTGSNTIESGAPIIEADGLAVSPDGSKVALLSTTEQGCDILLWEPDEGKHAVVAKLAGPALAPCFSPDGDALYLPASRNGFYVLHRFDLPALGNAPQHETSFTTAKAVDNGDTGLDVASSSTRYEPRYSLDILQSEIAFGPEVSTSLGAIVGLTDTLSDRRFSFIFGSTAESTSELLDGLSAGVSYSDYSRRLGWHVAGFRFVESSNLWQDETIYDEVRSGIQVGARYPLDTFNRLDLDLIPSYNERTTYEFDERTGKLGQVVSSMPVGGAYLTFSHDAALWQVDGPIDGDALSLSVGSIQDLRDGSSRYFSIFPNLRKYIRLGKSEAVALRLLGKRMIGPEAEDSPFRFGGSLSMRGWSWRDFNGTNTVLFNTELRFNVADRILADTFIGELNALPLRGAIFIDLGEAWFDELPDHFRGDMGFGLRWALGGVIVLRFDWAKRATFYYGDAVSRKGGEWIEFKQGFPFAFFVGWSY